MNWFEKIYKYEIDSADIEEDTEQTWFRPQSDGQMDARTDERTDKVKSAYHTFNFVEAGV